MAPEIAAHLPLQGSLCAGDRGQSPNPAERPRVRDREFHSRPLEEDAGQTRPRFLGIGTGGTGSGGFCDELESFRRRVSQRLGLLSRKLEAAADRLGGGKVDDESEDLHLGAAERAQQWVDLVDAADQLRPGEPSTSAELVVVLARRRLDCVSALGGALRRLPRAALA